jgi:hypothetical protein
LKDNIFGTPPATLQAEAEYDEFNKMRKIVSDFDGRIRKMTDKGSGK